MHFLRCPSTVPRHEEHAAQEGHECTGVADDMRHIRMRRGNKVDELPALQHPQYAIAQLFGPMNGSKVPGRAGKALIQAMSAKFPPRAGFSSRVFKHKRHLGGFVRTKGEDYVIETPLRLPICRVKFAALCLRKRLASF